MDGKKVNLTVTDPPYNVNYEGKPGTIQNDDMGDKDFIFMEYAFGQSKDWYLVEVHISGNMNLFYSAGEKMEGIDGTQIESKALYGTLIDRQRMTFI